MRSLVAALLILATPLCAQAGGRWSDSRAATGFYAQPGRGAYAPPGRGGAPAGPGRRPYGGPPRQGPPPAYAGPPVQGGYGPPRTQQQHAREDMRAGRRMPLPLVIERVRRQLGGAEYVNTSEVMGPGGRPLYMLRFRQRGRYIDVPVDAETGEVQR